MNDFMEAAGPVAIILITLAMYVFAAQLVNDPACASIDSSITLIIGKLLSKFLLVCWW